MGVRAGVVMLLVALLGGCIGLPPPVSDDVPAPYQAPLDDRYEWSPGPPLPEPVGAAACVAFQRQAWLLGGVGPGGLPTPSVRSYEPVLGTWNAQLALPQPVHHAAATVVAGALQVTGGYADIAGTQPSDRVYQRSAIGIYQDAAPLPMPLAQHRFLVVEDQRLLVGGTSDGRVAVSDILGWDARSWGPTAALATARAGAALAATPDGGIIAAGGWARVGVPLGTAQAQDLGATSVRDYDTMPTPRIGAAHTSWDGGLFLIGGRTAQGDVSAAVDLLRIDTGDWYRVASLPTPVSDACAVVLGDGVHVFGGFDGDGRATSGHWVLQRV